jgi:hypothetical protein
MGMRPYVVQQGETVASIVLPLGGDPDAVWNAPENGTLRETRSDPAVLCPLDVLYIPDDPPAAHTVQAGSMNSFTSPVATETVTLVLCADQPLKNTSYVIKGLGDDKPGTTKDDGSLEVDVPVNVDTFVLELTDQAVAHQVLVRHLDPITQDSGVQQRLSNRGHGSPVWELLGPFTTEGGDPDVDPTFTIRMFQIQNGTQPTGQLDAASLEALGQAHGT